MTEAQLSTIWREITDKEWWFYLEVVVPVRMGFNAFMSGEPITDGVNGTLHNAVCLVEGRCFMRPATLELFNPAKYTMEIKQKYFPGKYPGRES